MQYRRCDSMREDMKAMTVREIIVDVLHIIWYIAWRWSVVMIAFFGLMYLVNWEWWR